ncbi:ATP-binding cassette domain-containing protein [Rhodobacterales bacterium HKCCA1288]|jgi:ATP-binding cassette subfamily B protein|uniref:ABC transporter transmembrane domain-containing protein n=1 Tax=Roseovarius sp. 10 TaxID=3080563 RepID=UPI0019369B94|nr:ABC transporter transmembrane domain-containing protein [Roseovarius sp. 10]MBF9056662.1 ATP-binding cassette domain-containing protein [Rhodobacterales bacterium HKCCA1065]MDV7200801.1 ABC transporter transmembrane domain-containing protein [Roseovarius sp. 10]QPI85356.1 ATP-binding cassette domain-containing protein [Rhodobacterales bacterium HKCCA1288]
MTTRTDAAKAAPPAKAANATEERARSKKIGSLRALVPFLVPYRVWIIGAGLALVTTALVALIMPLAVRRVVDGFETNTAALLDSYFLAALGIAGLLALGTGARYYLVTRLGERVIADIRKAVFFRMISMSPSFYEKVMTGEVLSRITTDTTLLLSVISSSVSVALRNALILMGGLVMMVVTSPKLTGMVLLLVPAIIVPIVVLGRKLRALSRENQDWIAQSSGAASEALLAAQTVQAFTHERASSNEFSNVTEASFTSAKRRISTRAFMTVIVIFLVFAGIVGVLWVGARDVRADAMSIGALIQFLIYAIMVAGAVGALSEIWGELQRAAGATERLVELVYAEDTVTDPARPVPLTHGGKGDIMFDGVGFAYPTRAETAALTDVSFTIKAGETVALVGPSGAGKSTIFQLLQRFYDPQTGKITLDGVDLRDMRREGFRAAMALVPQDPVIFAASARDNIRFGRPDATDAEVEAAARAAAAHEFLAALPEGYDSYVGERGIMLSGGQKQRIAIARAILRDAPILLLDEATSALDAESERLVQRAVADLSAERTTLIVAHRLATVKKADRILVFDAGQIVAEGSHDALVAEGGLYARLARLQFTDGIAAE